MLFCENSIVALGFGLLCSWFYHIVGLSGRFIRSGISGMKSSRKYLRVGVTASDWMRSGEEA